MATDKMPTDNQTPASDASSPRSALWYPHDPRHKKSREFAHQDGLVRRVEALLEDYRPDLVLTAIAKVLFGADNVASDTGESGGYSSESDAHYVFDKAGEVVESSARRVEAIIQATRPNRSSDQ